MSDQKKKSCLKFDLQTSRENTQSQSRFTCQQFWKLSKQQFSPKLKSIKMKPRNNPDRIYDIQTYIHALAYMEVQQGQFNILEKELQM